MTIKSIILMLTLLVLIVLSACSGGPVNVFALADESQLPAFLDDAPVRVRQAYQFAIANPHELEKYPCYCGCGAMGHQHNLHCYIQDISLTGVVKFDEHAAGCGICVDITIDVMRLLNEGKTSREIRAYIDATYSPFGPSTNTPPVS